MIDVVVGYLDDPQTHLPMLRIPLSRVLPWLTRPAALRHWTCVSVLPDPAKWAGLQPMGTERKNYTEFYMRFTAEPGVGLEAYGLHGPIETFAYNHSRQQPYGPGERPDDYPMSSEWACIIDMQGTNTGPDGTPVSNMLQTILKRFPKYDLDSDEGVRNAMRDITSKLAQVTDLEAVSDTVSNETSGQDQEK